MEAYFEYYQILVTSDGAPLRRHMDYKNDWRKFFNHTYVHLFSQIVHEIEYKVSIIITTRRDVGKAMEKINTNISLGNKRNLVLLYKS